VKVKCYQTGLVSALPLKAPATVQPVNCAKCGPKSVICSTTATDFHG